VSEIGRVPDVVDSALGVLSEGPEQEDDWASADRSFCEEYAEGDVRVHLLIRPRDRAGGNYSATFERCSADPHLVRESPSRQHVQSTNDDVYIAVLVDVVQSDELSEGVPTLTVPSVIWLRALDGIDQVRLDPSQVRLAVAVEVGTSRPNEETVFGRVLGTAHLHQLIDQMIQRGPQVIQNLADPQTPLGVWLGRIIDDPKAGTGLSFELGEHGITLRIGEPFEIFFEVVGIELGSPELPPTWFEGWAHGD
jgi:hypothetical protein